MSTPKIPIDDDDYLELWKWFQEDAAKIKERMWTIANFFYTLLGGTLGFIGKHLLVKNSFSFDNPQLALIIAKSV